MPKQLRMRAKLALAMALKTEDPVVRVGLITMAAELLDRADEMEGDDEIVPGYAAHVRRRPDKPL
jgi:hypothetical protein